MQVSHHLKREKTVGRPPVNGSYLAEKYIGRSFVLKRFFILFNIDINRKINIQR